MDDLNFTGSMMPETPEKPAPAAKPARKRRKRSKAELMVLRRKRNNHRLVLLLFGAVVIVCLANLVSCNKTYSDSENRNLAQRPALSLSALADGSWFTDYNSFYTDQFFARDRWITLKLKADKLIGKKEEGGIYLCSNGYLIPEPDEPDEDAYSASAKAVNLMAEQYPDVSMTMMLVPGAATVLSDYLPNNAPVRDQNEDIAAAESLLSAGIQTVDMGAALAEHKDEYIYYKTDHHWTSRGAYYGFLAASTALGLELSSTDYDVYTVADDFQGTCATKSGSHSVNDTVQVYTLKNSDVDYYVTYPDTDEKTCSIYKLSCLDDRDKYTVFFGGNHPLVEINTTANNGRNLLVFKDSYANSFIQFLIPYFENIIMVDPRYYYDDVSTLMTSENITDVLFLFSSDTFLTDTSIPDVLATAIPDETDTFNTDVFNVGGTADTAAAEASSSETESVAEETAPAEETQDTAESTEAESAVEEAEE